MIGMAAQGHEDNLTIVFAAGAVSHWIENRTGWSIKKFVHTIRPVPHGDDPSRTTLPVVTPKPGLSPRQRDATTARGMGGRPGIRHRQ